MPFCAYEFSFFVSTVSVFEIRMPVSDLILCYVVWRHVLTWHRAQLTPFP
jgi:hypothetical protein